MDTPKVDTGPDKTVRKAEVAGIPVNIERPKGVIKVFPEGYTQLYKADYGSTPLAKGVDGDPLDVFVGPDKGSKRVFVVDKMDDKNHAKFDEHKVMLGFRDRKSARTCAGFHLWGTDGKIREMGVERFLKSLDGGKTGLGKQAADALRLQVLEHGSMINPLQFAGFCATIADDVKVALSFSDIPPEVLGALAGGTLGGVGGYSATQDPMNKKRNAAIGAVAGATAGAGLANLLRGDSGGQKVTNTPGAAPAKPGVQEPGKLQAAQVEPVLQQSENTARQQAQQQMTNQAVQFSAAREKALLLRDQGQVAARTQELLAPRGIPSMPGVKPRNIVLGPGVRMMPGPWGPRLQKHGSLPEVDWGGILQTLQDRPEIATGVIGAGLGTGIGWSTADKKTRKRKMLMGALLGGGTGGGVGYLGNQLANAAGALQSGGEALEQAGSESAGSAGAATRLLDTLNAQLASPQTQQAIAQTGQGVSQGVAQGIAGLVSQLQGLAQ